MNFGVIVFPGSNCDKDCQQAAQLVTGQPVRMIWHKESSVGDVDAIIIPGGFSYGDYLRTGSIARFSPVMTAVAEFANQGGLVIGICNGFQILLEAGLLPGALLRNACLNFVCRDIYLKVENNQTPFTLLYAENEIIRVPVAHGEGNYFIDKAGLADLEKNHQIVFRYVDACGCVTPEASPNGSMDNIAGICNKAGNVLGMMPHPERISEEVLGGIGGSRVFLSMLESWRKGVKTHA
jgi:phosphoribosylformylglycinamidine synthase